MRIEVLGPVRLRCGQQVVDPGPPKQRALLAALVVDAERVLSADSLIDRVWGEGSASPGSVHVAVSHVRRRLRECEGAPVIETVEPGYRLDVAGSTVDALEFADHLAAARRLVSENDVERARIRLDEALALWRGEPYADVSADFARQEASRLRSQHDAAVELGVELDLQLGRHGMLADSLQALVTADPLREGLRASWMLALYRTGRQAEALQVFAHGRDLLADELGIDPGPALRSLHQRILEQDPALDAPAPAAAAAVLPAPAPARPAVTQDRDAPVGRDAEIGEMTEAIDRLDHDGPFAFVLVGEAGVGKSTVVERATSTSHALTVVGRCWAQGQSAYWPWVQALTALVEHLGADAAGRAMQGEAADVALLLRGSLPQAAHRDDSQSTRTTLFRAVAEFLRRAAVGRRLVVVLEDLQWADTESVDLVDFVVSTLVGSLGIIVTVRDPAETVHDAGPQVVAALARRPRVTQLTLKGLDVADVASLASRHTARELTADAALELHRRTEGNPFFIVELARLHDHDGTTRIPRSVRAVIDRRIGHLSVECVEVLTVAAILGHTFDLPIVASVMGRSVLSLAPWIDEAGAAGIVSPDGGVDRQRFTHDLVRESMLAGTGPMRCAALHAAAAEALEADLESRPFDAAAVAHHWIAAGSVGSIAKAVRASMAAARVDEQNLALHEAENRLRQALGLLPQVRGSEAVTLELDARTQLSGLLAKTHGFDYPSTQAERRRSLEIARSVGTPDQLARALYGEWEVALNFGDFGAAAAISAELDLVVPDTQEPMLPAMADLARGQVAWHLGDTAHAAETLQRAADRLRGLEVPMQAYAQHPEPLILAVVTIARAQLEQRELAEAASRRAMGHWAVQEHDFTRVQTTFLLGIAEVVLDRPHDAWRFGEESLRVGRHGGFDASATYGLLSRGWGRAVATGDFAAGIEDLRSALASPPLGPGRTFRHLACWLLGDLLHRSGDIASAAVAVADGLAECETIGEVTFHPQLVRLAKQLDGIS